MDLTRPYPPDPYAFLPPVPSFTVTSEDVADGQPMDRRYTQDGDNVSPQLSWYGFPLGTRAFALSCFDPDAPTPAGFWHWTVVNIPMMTTTVDRGFGNPDAKPPVPLWRARNDAGTLGYAGAAPPPGDQPHRYFFAVHALETLILGDDGPTCTQAAFQLVFHTIGRAIIAPTYQRPAI